MKTNQKSDLAQRIWTAIIFGATSLFFVVFNDNTRVLFLMLVAILCSYEYLRMRNRDQWFSLLFPTAVFLMATSYFSQLVFVHEYYYIIACLFFHALALFGLKFKKLMAIHSHADLIISLLGIVLPLSLTASAIIKQQFDHSYILLIVVLLIWSSDTFAYLIGRKIGKHKFWPSVSPNKTMEGFFGAGICTILLGAVIAYFSSESLTEFMLLGAIIWLLGSFGDLVQSSIKRYSSKKDSGNLLPGHGGFWDRFDSFIFVLPYLLVIQYIQ